MGYHKDLGDGRYRLFAEMGRDNKAKRRRKTKVVKASGIREANRLLADFEYEVRNSEELNIENLTFQSLVERWRTNFADQKLAATTSEVYDYALKPISEHFWDVIVREIHTLDIEEFFTAQVNGGHGSLEKKYFVLMSIFNHALKWGVLETNPMDTVSKPHLKPVKKQPYTFEEVRKIAEHFPSISKYHQRLIMIAFEFSLRRGEVIAIADDVLDYNKGGIWIKRALIYTKKTGKQLKCTKTGDETFLHCTKELMDELRAQRNFAMRNKLLAGSDWKGFKDSDGNEVLLLFADELGEPYHPNAVTRFWGRFIKRTGLRHIRFHDLRHSSASIMARDNVNMRAIQQRLRHSKLTTTNRYLHTNESDDMIAADTFKGIWQQDKAK